MTIRLEKMNSTEFKQYLDYAIKNYAEEHIKSGNWEQQEAISKATKELTELLPEEEKTAKNYLFTIRDKEQKIGMIWLG